MNRIHKNLSRRVAGNRFVGLTAATLLAGGFAVHAQPIEQVPQIQPAPQSEIEILREQLRALQTRLETLEADQKTLVADQKKTSEAAAKAPAVTSKSPVTVSGLLQVQANTFHGESGDTFPRQANTFRLRRADIRITAPSITSRISGSVAFDLAKFVNNSSTTPFAVNASSNVLQEIQLSYLLRKAANAGDNIYIDLGQFKIPLGYEGDLVSSSALQTVERALLFRARDVSNGGAGDIRDTGVQLRGSAGQIDYRLGVFNGLGERQNALSSSDRKAIIGRLAFRPKGIEGLQVGVSAARGDTGNLSTAVGVDPTQRFDRDLLNAFIAYKRNKWSLQSEYLTGSGQNLAVGGVAGARRDLRGYYASAGYLFTPKIEGVLRYDYFDFARNLDLDTQVKELTAGINYYIKGNNAKIQLNLVRVQGGDDLTAANGFGGGSQGQGLRNDRTEIRAQGQVAF